MCGTEITWKEILRQEQEKARLEVEAAEYEESIQADRLAAEREHLANLQMQMEFERWFDDLEERDHRRRVNELNTAFIGCSGIALGMAAVTSAVGFTIWAMVLYFGPGWTVFFVLIFSPIWLPIVILSAVGMRGSFYDRNELK